MVCESMGEAMQVAYESCGVGRREPRHAGGGTPVRRLAPLSSSPPPFTTCAPHSFSSRDLTPHKTDLDTPDATPLCAVSLIKAPALPDDSPRSAMKRVF